MNNNLPLTLGDGLVLRWATAADSEQLAGFNIRIHTDDPSATENWLGDWTCDLMNGRHPTTNASDFTIVVDEKQGGKIVSSACLIPQTWRYEDVPFSCGRPELIGTDPAYRRHGLVRAQMQAIHAKSAAQGELVQAITGIPWYYRQFGYEMALDLDSGRKFYWDRSGNNKKVAQESYRLRPATAVDIPTLNELYAIHCTSSLINCERDKDTWHYLLSVANRETPPALHAQLIETAVGEVVGYVEYRVWGSRFYVRELAVKKGYSWRAVGLFLTRALKQKADVLNKSLQRAINHINFGLSSAHPIHHALGRQLAKQQRPYAWYLRVPDLPTFLKHITPVLDRRLADSVLTGHNGQLKLNFYRSMLTLTFAQGRLSEIIQGHSERAEGGDARLPDLTFLQLLFGYRSLEQLEAAFADCSARIPEAAVLLEVLFPQRPSQVATIG